MKSVFSKNLKKYMTYDNGNLFAMKKKEIAVNKKNNRLQNASHLSARLQYDSATSVMNQ